MYKREVMLPAGRQLIKRGKLPSEIEQRLADTCLAIAAGDRATGVE